MRHVPGELAGHPDRLRWNARYAASLPSPFAPHPLAAQALSLPLPRGPVAELACGPSGGALLAAAAGRRVTAVDVSDVALGQLAAEASRAGLGDLILLMQADLATWRPPASYALMLCTGYWDRGVFRAAAAAVAPGGVLAWEARTAGARAEWCLRPGEPASLLPRGFAVLGQEDLTGEHAPRRRLLARKAAPVTATQCTPAIVVPGQCGSLNE